MKPALQMVALVTAILGLAAIAGAPLPVVGAMLLVIAAVILGLAWRDRKTPPH